MTRYKLIDMESYPRREHFKLYSAMPDPMAGITAKIDVTRLVRFAKERGCSFYSAMIHVVCLAANRIPEFRRRTLDGGIIEYDTCGTSNIELPPDGVYCYCTLRHDMSWDEYIPYAAQARQKARTNPSIEEDADVGALYFITTLPWIHYDQIIQTLPAPVSDNPRFCWGKYDEDRRGRLMMPFTVLASHALMDGMHFGKLFAEIDREITSLDVSE